MTIKIYLIRHSLTLGNLEKRYIGRTDEPLCREGTLLLKGRECPSVQAVFSSPKKRCVQTAQLLYPGQQVQVIQQLRECDFGRFENKNYQELNGNPEYQQWIDSGGTTAFPGGEAKETFMGQCQEGFRQAVSLCRKEKYGTAALIVHGGTIMSIMEKYAVPKKDYYDFHVENGEGYEISITDTTGYYGTFTRLSVR